MVNFSVFPSSIRFHGISKYKQIIISNVLLNFRIKYNHIQLEIMIKLGTCFLNKNHIFIFQIIACHFKIFVVDASIFRSNIYLQTQCFKNRTGPAGPTGRTVDQSQNRSGSIKKQFLH